MRSPARCVAQLVLTLWVRSVFPAAVALFAPSLSHADETSESLVLVSVAGHPNERSALLEALREPLDSLSLTMRTSRNDDDPPAFASAPPGTRARVWIDARPLDHVDIFVWTTLGAPGAPAHRVIPRSGSTAVVAEEVAYVVRATLDSLLSEPASVPPPPPPLVPVAPTADTPSSPRAPAVAARASGRFGFDASAFATAQGVASSLAAFGGGLGVDLAPWGAHPLHPTLWLDASVNAPFESITAEATLETTLYSVRAIPGIEVAEFGRFHLGAGAGFGVDFLHTSPGQGSTSSGVKLSAATVEADPILEAQLLLHAPLARSAGIVLGLNLDYDAGPHQYIERGATGPATTVFAPSSVRPSAMLGLCLPLLGDPACAGLP